MTTRRHILAGAAALAGAPLFARAQGGAQNYPDRPIRLIVPNPPGGLTDIVGRFLSEPMRASLGQTLVIDNRPGAAGLIGTAAVATAPADGYTLLMTTRTNHVMAPLVQGTKTVDPARDLVSVGLALRPVSLLVTHAHAPFKTLKDFIAQAKARPGKLFYGSSGIGSTNHISIEQFKELVGVDITHVPYKGSGPLITGLMGGEVAFGLTDFFSVQAGLESGTLVALAQTGSRRLQALPKVPTLAEAGHGNFDPSFWIGLAAPRATPAPILQRVNAAMNAALAETQMKARAQVYGWELVGGSPEVLAQTIAQDMATYPALVRKLDIRAS